MKKPNFNLLRFVKKTRTRLSDHEAEIFEAHQMMLRDPEWIKSIENHVNDNKCIAWAVQLTTDSFVAMLEGIDDPYLKARANDLKDVSERVLRILLGIEKVSLDHLPQGTI